MKKYLVKGAILICAVLSRGLLFAQAGTPDMTWNSDGQLDLLDMPNDVITSSILQADGFEYAFLTDVNSGSNSYIIKMDNTGNFVNSFGTAGVLTLENTILYDAAFSPNQQTMYLCANIGQFGSVCEMDLNGSITQNWVQLQEPIGFARIVCNDLGEIFVGSGTTVGADSYSMVLKLHSDLTPDLSYSADGKAVGVQTGFGYPLMEMSNDGRIIMATSSPNGVIIDRFTTSGDPDNTFVLNLNLSSYSLPNWILDIAVAPDNSIYIQPNTYGYPNYLFKVNGEGNLDNNFGSGGYIIIEDTDPLFYVAPDELIIEPDGGLIVLATAFDGSSYMAGKFIYRLDSTGAVDNTINNGPQPINDGGQDLRINFHCATLQDDGKILSMDQVVVWQNGALLGYRPLLTRYNNELHLSVENSMNESHALTCFPNPTTGILRINDSSFTDVSNVKVSVYDCAGNLTKHTRINGNILDISALPEGLYTIVLLQNGQMQTLRVIKV
jgi:Secretion system C-terminal sorting domain